MAQVPGFVAVVRKCCRDDDSQVVPEFDPKSRENQKQIQSESQSQSQSQLQQRPAPKLQVNPNPMPILTVQNSNQHQVPRPNLNPTPTSFSGQSVTFQQLQPQIKAPTATTIKRPHAEVNGANRPLLNSPSLSTADLSISNPNPNSSLNLILHPEGNSLYFKRPRAVLNPTEKQEFSSFSPGQKSLMELAKKVEISTASSGATLPFPFPTPLQFRPIFIQVERITIALPLKKLSSVSVLSTRLAKERKVHQAFFDQLVKIGDESNSNISRKLRDFKVCLDKILRSLFLPEVWRQITWTGAETGKLQFHGSPIQLVAFQALRFHHPNPNPTEEELKTAAQNWIRINAK